MKIIFISLFFLICCAPAANEADSNLQVERITPGAERTDEYLPLLRSQQVGLVANHTSLVGEEHLLDVLLANDVQVEKVMSPEHGFRGDADAGAKIVDGVDEKTGLPVISLYGDHRKPTPEDIDGLDVIVFDLQDVGVRFYTYISTLHLVMEACAEAGLPVIVLDRPNPNGYYVDGPVLEPEYMSFVGMHEIPVVYGLTIGELAGMINGEGWLENGAQCDLTVIKCTGYDHTMTYDLPVAPSPNLPNLRSVLLYPSLCFFEGTTVSVGRGTNTQFQVIGHPKLMTGSYTFTPKSMPGALYPKHEGVQLYGTGLASLDIQTIRQWERLNLSWLIGYYEELAPKNQFFLENNFIDKLAGTDKLRKQIIDGMTEEEIRGTWKEGIEVFKKNRQKYLLYPDFE